MTTAIQIHKYMQTCCYMCVDLYLYLGIQEQVLYVHLRTSRRFITNTSIKWCKENIQIIMTPFKQNHDFENAVAMHISEASEIIQHSTKMWFFYACSYETRNSSFKFQTFPLEMPCAPVLVAGRETIGWTSPNLPRSGVISLTIGVPHLRRFMRVIFSIRWVMDVER